MALILDKSITGVTLTDISGNTLETGFTFLNYEDNYGNIHENPYFVVDEVTINKLIGYCKITGYIYKDVQSRESKLEPLEKYVSGCFNDIILYDEYFSLEVMENKNIFEVAYNFLKGEKLTGWKSDEI